jgi:hypothetical protein
MYSTASLHGQLPQSRNETNSAERHVYGCEKCLNNSLSGKIKVVLTPMMVPLAVEAKPRSNTLFSETH